MDSGLPKRLQRMEFQPHETVLPTRGVELCVQTLGDRDHPPILLIHGGASAMDFWDIELCRRLAGGPRYVVRYDHRDTGQSTSYPPGAPGYTGRDLADDAVAILDGLGVASAHLVGQSMGGGIAQVIALDHPERVRSLTLLATSPVGALPEGIELPPTSDELAAMFDSAGPEPDWSDRDAVIEYLVDSFRPYAGSGPFDETGLRSAAERVVDRSRSVASANNHFIAEPGPEPTRTLGDVDVPTLVVHGTEDPLFPLPHGETLARLITGAELLVVERMGHELPRWAWDTIAPAILTHTAAAAGRPGPSEVKPVRTPTGASQPSDP
jgi:pimeloyl-ACP methyl ester carboxylesterase